MHINNEGQRSDLEDEFIEIGNQIELVENNLKESLKIINELRRKQCSLYDRCMDGVIQIVEEIEFERFLDWRRYNE